MQSCLPSNPTCHRIPERSRRVLLLKSQGSLSEVEGSALKKSNRRMLRLRSAILDTLCNPACLAILPAIGSLSEVEGSAPKKSNRRMLRQAQQSWTDSAILGGLSNPGRLSNPERLSKAAIYFVMERPTRKPASVPHLPVSSSLAEPSTTTFFISSMRCNRLHCMLRHFFWL